MNFSAPPRPLPDIVCERTGHFLCLLMMCRFNERSQSVSVPEGRGPQVIYTDKRARGMLSHRGSICEEKGDTIPVDDMITQRDGARYDNRPLPDSNLRWFWPGKGEWFASFLKQRNHFLRQVGGHGQDSNVPNSASVWI